MPHIVPKKWMCPWNFCTLRMVGSDLDHVKNVAWDNSSYCLWYRTSACIPNRLSSQAQSQASHLQPLLVSCCLLSKTKVFGWKVWKYDGAKELHGYSSNEKRAWECVHWEIRQYIIHVNQKPTSALSSSTPVLGLEVHLNFKVAFSTFWFNPYDVKPSGARHKPCNLT